MTKKFTIPFLVCILSLIACEYFLLQEVFSNKRFSFLLISAIGLILSIVFFWFFYKKHQKAAK